VSVTVPRLLPVFLLLTAGCESSSASDPNPGSTDAAASCGRLFGIFGEKSGLSEEQCTPTCDGCSEAPYHPAEPSEERIARLTALTLENPGALLLSDPYLDPSVWAEEPTSICAVKFSSSTTYSLATYDAQASAEADDAVPTHFGACGACSSLQDLAVYMEIPDLTDPVRRCGVRNITGDEHALAECIGELGFSANCAQIWAYNSLNTREACLDECLEAIDAPYHQADGSPNACILCDEVNSGPVFKAAAGRTRRNSGLPTPLCRPCADVARFSHDY